MGAGEWTRRISVFLVSAVIVLLGCGSFAHAQQTITLLERIQTEGTVKTVGLGVITVTGADGKDT